MPNVPTPEGPSKDTAYITIPRNLRGYITQWTGYNGPWRMPRGEANALLRDAQNAQQEAEGAATPPGGTTIIVTGGSSGGSAGMSAKQKANLRNSYLAMLQSFGINLTKNLNNLMDRGVGQEWSTTSFLIHLRRTAEYKHQFPGIRSSDGTSEAQYNAQYKAFADEAKAAGITLTRAQFGLLFKKDVRAADWQIRVEFMKRAKNNKAFFDQLELVARARGIIKPKEQLSKKELYDAMLHKGNPKIEKLLEEANTRYQLDSLGFTVGKDGDIGRKMLLNFIKRMETDGFDVEAANSEAFAGLAEKVRTVLPAAEQIGAGITKRDLFELEFGADNARRQEIAQHVQGILDSYDQRAEKLVKPLVTEREGGHTGIVGIGGLSGPAGL